MGADPPDRRLRLVVAYDGAPFAGFARQPDRRTVQGELEGALSRLARRPVQTVGAGRTDAGVHARGQVVHADVPSRLDPERVRRALNGSLGPAITVREATWAPPGFDARLSARRRAYVYRIDDSGNPDPLLRGFVLDWPRPLDLPRMREAARPLVGEHDFAAYCRRRPGASTVRRLLSLSWVREASGLAVAHVLADGFCHNMVRSLVGALLSVGDGHRPVEWPGAVLTTGVREPGVQVVPPHGLTLEEIRYPANPAEMAARAIETRRHRG